MEKTFTRIPFQIAEAFAQAAFQYKRNTVLFTKRYDDPKNNNAYLALVELDTKADLRYALVLVEIEHSDEKIMMNNKELPGLFTFKEALVKFSEHLQLENLAMVN